jgi:prepilin-type N-terminal cleavage/methylation domain-containing protein
MQEASMDDRPRRPLREQAGFALVELLIVVALVGTLTAIAAPTLMTQQRFGEDADAMSAAKNAAAAMEARFLSWQTYAGATPSELAEFQPSLADVDLRTRNLADDGYSVVVISTSGTRFTLRRRPNGTVVRTCDQRGVGACPGKGRW